MTGEGRRFLVRKLQQRIWPFVQYHKESVTKIHLGDLPARRVRARSFLDGSHGASKIGKDVRCDIIVSLNTINPAAPKVLQNTTNTIAGAKREQAPAAL
jgi:hypothetical protein